MFVILLVGSGAIAYSVIASGDPAPTFCPGEWVAPPAQDVRDGAINDEMLDGPST